MINQYFNHVDEVTVNRDKLSVLLWEQTGPLTSDLPAEAPFDWLWLRDHKHSPWAWWTVMDGNAWATRSAKSAPHRFSHLTSDWCLSTCVWHWLIQQSICLNKLLGILFGLDELGKKSQFYRIKKKKQKLAGVWWSLLSNKQKLLLFCLKSNWF